MIDAEELIPMGLHAAVTTGRTELVTLAMRQLRERFADVVGIGPVLNALEMLANDRVEQNNRARTRPVRSVIEVQVFSPGLPDKRVTDLCVQALADILNYPARASVVSSSPLTERQVMGMLEDLGYPEDHFGTLDEDELC